MAFEIDDTSSFEENLDTFLKSLEADDPKLASALRDKLSGLLRGDIQTSDVWAALDEAGKERA